MRIVNCEQGSPEWFDLRLGSIGGSSIAAVCSKGQGRKTLMYRMAGEILSGQPYNSYQNEHMRRGLEREPEARDLYSETKSVEVTQVGLIQRRPFIHHSPDGLVGDDGMIEIKCVIPSVHVETIVTGRVPAAYRKQVQWGLACKRQYCDFVSYCPEIKSRPLYIIRVERDDTLIKEMDEAADLFLREMLTIIKRVKED